jgi:hypothetical protein
MIHHMVQEHVYLNPTLDFEWKGIIDRTRQFELEDQRPLFNPLLQYVPMDERLVTLGQYHWADTRADADREQFLKGYKNVQEFIRTYVRAGGKLYSGTDSAAANTPGLALHHKMQLLVDAGVPHAGADGVNGLGGRAPPPRLAPGHDRAGQDRRPGDPAGESAHRHTQYAEHQSGDQGRRGGRYDEVSATEITAVLTPKQTADAGNYLISVQTPKPGGGVSEEVGFIIDYQP